MSYKGGGKNVSDFLGVARREAPVMLRSNVTGQLLLCFRSALWAPPLRSRGTGWRDVMRRSRLAPPVPGYATGTGVIWSVSFSFQILVRSPSIGTVHCALSKQSLNPGLDNLSLLYMFEVLNIYLLLKNNNGSLNPAGTTNVHWSDAPRLFPCDRVAGRDWRRS